MEEVAAFQAPICLTLVTTVLKIGCDLQRQGKGQPYQEKPLDGLLVVLRMAPMTTVRMQKESLVPHSPIVAPWLSVLKDQS